MENGLDSWTQSVAIDDAAVHCQLGEKARVQEQGLYSLVERRQKGQPTCPTATCSCVKGGYRGHGEKSSR